MGDQSIYIFPTGATEPVGFCERSIAVLTTVGLVAASAEQTADLAMFEPGDDSQRFLSASFEYLGVRCGPFPTLIPEDPAVEPRCPRCSADIQESWYSCVNDACDVEQRQDWSLLRVPCAHCEWLGRLDEVVDAAGVGAFLQREFLFLANVQVSDAEFAGFAARIQRLLGDVSVKLYWYT